MRLPLLAILLAGLWVLMSGHLDALLLGLGAVSVVLVVWLSARMGIVDSESLPLHLAPRTPAFAMWLLVEVVASNLAVARRVLSPRLRTEPRVLTVEGPRSDEVARTLFANSITLTPGTVTIDVSDDGHFVHALTREAADGLAAGGMLRRVRRVAGESP